MDNKKWNDKDLRTAFEDGCKFINFADLQDFLLKRKELADSYDRQLIIPAVMGELPINEVIGMDNPFPLPSVLGHLINAAEFLLHKQGYDGGDYEEIEECVRRAKYIAGLFKGN